MLAYSTGRTRKDGGATHVHVVHPGSMWDTEYRGKPFTRASWSCKASSWAGPVVEVDAVPDGMVACPRCDVYGIQQSPCVVYFAAVGNCYKVGFTTKLTQRMSNLGARLIAFKPGSIADEREVQCTLADVLLPETREWYPRTPDVFRRIAPFFPALNPIFADLRAAA